MSLIISISITDAGNAVKTHFNENLLHSVQIMEQEATLQSEYQQENVVQ